MASTKKRSNPSGQGAGATFTVKVSKKESVPAEIAAAPRRKKLYFGLDVEKCGRHATDSLIAVGFAVASTTDGTIEKKRWCFPGPYAFEPRCIVQFWSKHPMLLEKLTLEGLGQDTSELFKNLSGWLHGYEGKTGDGNGRGYNWDASLVCDNPAYDVAQLDMAWEEETPGHIPLHHTRIGDYRSVYDCSERLRALEIPMDEVTGFLTRIGVSQTHCPDDDAEVIVWKMFVAMAYQAFRKEVGGSTTMAAFIDVLKSASAKSVVLRLAQAAEQDHSIV